MVKTIVELIDLAVSSLMSEMICKKNASFWDRVKFSCFNKNLRRWVSQFINGNDGTVLTTDDFERYFRYHKPVEKIYEAIVGENLQNTKDKTIDELVSKFKSTRTQSEHTAPEEYMLIRDLFSGIYNRIDQFYWRQLSDSEKYIVTQIKKEAGEIATLEKKGNEQIEQSVREVKELLKEGQQISHKDAQWIYRVVANLLTDGSAEAVYMLLPLLKKNTGDLEYAVPYLLRIMSNYDVDSKSFVDVQTCIKDDYIYADVARKTIFYSLISNSTEILHQVESRDADLNTIASCLVSEKYESFYKRVEQNQNGIRIINIEVLPSYPNEKWLVERICVALLLRTQVRNASNAAVELLGKELTLTEKILFYERKIAELLYENVESTEKWTQLYEEMMEVRTKVNTLPEFLQIKFYSSILRLAIQISKEKGDEAVRELPKNIYTNSDIEMLCMHVAIMKGEADADEVVQICVKNEKYWLLNNYLVQYATEPVRIKQIIENYRFVLSKDLDVFLMYIDVISICEGKDKGKEMLESYEDRYSGYLEYWVEKVRLCVPNEAHEIVEYIRGKNGLLSCSPHTRVIYIQVLFNFGYFEDVLREVDREIACGTLVGDLQYIRAMALLKTNREIEALDAFSSLCSDGRYEPEWIFYILQLSNRNNREVVDAVLKTASTSTSAKILLCLSNYYEWHQNFDLAESTLLRAMFYGNDELVEVFGNYLRLHNSINSNNSPDACISDINTAVYLVSKAGINKKVYCIFKKHILPYETFEWEGACHIYKETAIQIGLYRKKVGDSVTIDDEEFEITELLTLECFLFRLSMQKTVDAGKAKYIYISVDSEGKPNIEEFKKELEKNIGDSDSDSDPQWLIAYKDISAIPVTLFYSEKFVRVNYVHFTLAMLRDTSIIMRESKCKNELSDAKYVLSFTTIIALHEIGFDLHNCTANVVIAESTKKEIGIETEQIVTENAREHVASMGMQGGQLYFNESSESEKQAIMQSAVSVKEFIQGIETVANSKDLQISEDPEFDCKEFLGICDYDAIAIAKEHKNVLVTFEAIITAFAGFSGIEVATIGVADFLANICEDLEKLLSYVQRMLELRFMYPITLKLFQKILILFETITDSRKRSVIDKWGQILDIPLHDKKYKDIIGALARGIYINAYGTIDTENPLWRIFVEYVLKYNGYKMRLFYSPSGGIEMKLVKSDEDQE